MTGHVPADADRYRRRGGEPEVREETGYLLEAIQRDTRIGGEPLQFTPVQVSVLILNPVHSRKDLKFDSRKRVQCHQ